MTDAPGTNKDDLLRAEIGKVLKYWRKKEMSDLYYPLDEILALLAQQRTLASLDARIDELTKIENLPVVSMAQMKYLLERIADLQAEKAKLIGGDK